MVQFFMQRFKFFYKEPLVHNTIRIFFSIQSIAFFFKKIFQMRIKQRLPAGQITLIFSFFIFTSLSIKLSIQAAEKTSFFCIHHKTR